jgi:hypothetical protein
VTARTHAILKKMSKAKALSRDRATFAKDSASPALKVLGDLLLKRVNHSKLFAETGLDKSLFPAFSRFQDFSYFAELDTRQSDSKTESGGCSQFLFHQFLSEISPAYRKAALLAVDLDIPFQGVIKSHARFRMEFDVLSGISEFPLVKDEMYWLARQGVGESGEFLHQWVELSKYSFPAHHEMLHAILMRVVPPGAGSLEEYLNFAEVLVGMLEDVVRIEMGHELYNEVAEFGTLWRRVDRVDSSKFQSAENFKTAFFEVLEFKTTQPSDWTRKWMPHYTKKKRQSLNSFPRSETGFKIADFSLSGLKKDSGPFLDLWRWFVSTFTIERGPGAVR